VGEVYITAVVAAEAAGMWRPNRAARGGTQHQWARLGVLWEGVRRMEAHVYRVRTGLDVVDGGAWSFGYSF
jgi:hypothetical protein